MENWKVESDEYGYYIVDHNNKLVCDVDGVDGVDCDSGYWDQLTEKRAKRIAACNEMLRALMLIDEVITTGQRPTVETHTIIRNAIKATE